MRITLVASEDILAGDMVAVDPGIAGRVLKCKPTGDFEQATAIGMAQNTTAAGNTVVITTDGPSQPSCYRGQLTPGEDYYVGVAGQLVTYSVYRQAIQNGGYDSAYMCHAGIAASTDQLAIDLEPAIYVLPNGL